MMAGVHGRPPIFSVVYGSVALSPWYGLFCQRVPGLNPCAPRAGAPDVLPRQPFHNPVGEEGKDSRQTGSDGAPTNNTAIAAANLTDVSFGIWSDSPAGTFFQMLS